MMANSFVEIAQALIRCRSVTPSEGGALTYLQDLLKRSGFETHRVKFSEPDMPEIDNLFAKIGSGAPHFVFAGHTDVVPAGDESRWKHGAFSGDVANGTLFGRGAVDMKGAIACFAAAALDRLAAGKIKGTISFLITGDEEGPAVNGTVKLLKWAKERGEKFDHCVVGEPTSVEVVGDTIKIGRRGSLSGTITVTGKSGHAAYPDRAENPVRALVNILQAIQEPLDDGSYHFQKSNLEVVSVDVGSGAAFNVIPAEAKAKFNVRFNDNHTIASLKEELLRRSQQAASATKFMIEWEPPSDVFVTKPGPFVDVLSTAVAEVTGKKPQLSTSGGTSDARFIKDYCEVVDLGLVGQTMHQIDESTPVADLERLTAIYRRVLDNYFR